MRQKNLQYKYMIKHCMQKYRTSFDIYRYYLTTRNCILKNLLIINRCLVFGPCTTASMLPVY